MWKIGILISLILITQCTCYNNFQNHKNNVESWRYMLEKKIEIYDSIKECDLTDIHSCGDECTLCSGAGEILCNYCRGTGFLTMGDVIIGTRNNCTLCNGKGETECKKCMGSGYIAKWRK